MCGGVGVCVCVCLCVFGAAASAEAVCAGCPVSDIFVCERDCVCVCVFMCVYAWYFFFWHIFSVFVSVCV